MLVSKLRKTQPALVTRAFKRSSWVTSVGHLQVNLMTMLEKLSVALSDGDWHSTDELVQEVGHRFSATIHVAIKKHGYKIEKRRARANQCEYRMLIMSKTAS